MIFVSFGKVHSANFFDKINFENFLLIKLYIQNLKNWERGSKIPELSNTLLYLRQFPLLGAKNEDVFEEVEIPVFSTNWSLLLLSFVTENQTGIE